MDRIRAILDGKSDSGVPEPILTQKPIDFGNRPDLPPEPPAVKPDIALKEVEEASVVDQEKEPRSGESR